jgi:hypothetical protein
MRAPTGVLKMQSIDDESDAPSPWDVAEEAPFQDHPDYDRAGFIFHDGRAARKRGEDLTGNPYTDDRLGYSLWARGWNMENSSLAELAEERRRNMRAPEPTPTLTLLGESFSAGDHEALHEALLTCFQHSTPPMRWIVSQDVV